LPLEWSAFDILLREGNMKILFWCDDLTNRMRLASAWKEDGATLLKKTTAETPDCIVIDLAVRNALAHIARLRASHPGVDIIAFGAKFDDETFGGALAAGATEVAALGSIRERITRRLPRAD
jgi:DNA-binding response OmpR family regulator